MSTFTCSKCSATVTEFCEGYSRSDERGVKYSYTRCVICGFVRHHLRGGEIREHVEITGGARIGVNVIHDRTRVVPRSKINAVDVS